MNELPAPLPPGFQGQPLSVVLFRLAHEGDSGRVSIGNLLAALGDRALAALMFVFAVPNVMPTPPGFSAVLGAPLIFLAAQLMLGMRPWLPGVITRRSLARDDLQTLVRRIRPWLARAETLLRPRWSGLTRPPVEYAIGLLCLVLAILLSLPIPLGNTLPALAISVLALGVLERDGLWVIAGTATAAFALAVVSGVVWAMAQAALYLVMRWMG
jgi:hypothetical protein